MKQFIKIALGVSALALVTFACKKEEETPIEPSTNTVYVAFPSTFRFDSAGSLSTIRVFTKHNELVLDSNWTYDERLLTRQVRVDQEDDNYHGKFLEFLNSRDVRTYDPLSGQLITTTFEHENDFITLADYTHLKLVSETKLQATNYYATSLHTPYDSTRIPFGGYLYTKSLKDEIQANMKEGETLAVRTYTLTYTKIK